MPTLHWIGKEKVVGHHHDVPFKILQKEYEYVAPEGSPVNSSGNKIIHGDNLEALKALLPEYEGKVKCIYIDIPYNTGNEGWVYNDNVKDPRIQRWLDQVVGKEGEDLTRHDKWLCMMYPRLKLLQRLLAHDGSIFVSIDDVEVSFLKVVMDEIFGNNKFIGQFVWKSRQNKDNRTKTGASIDHEYVLCYGESIRGDERDKDQYKNPDNDSRGPWASGNMVGLADELARPNLHYELINPLTGINYGKPKQGWRFDRARMARLFDEKKIIWPDKPTGRPRLKTFLAEMSSDFTGYPSIIGTNLFTYHGTREVDAIFGSKSFDFPKSSNFVMELLQQGAIPKDSIVLDSFAGSGTTAHALLKLNAQDGGNRRFILVEMMDYAETITAERVRRVISGYGEGDKAVAGLGGSFDYYTIGESLFDEDGNLNETVPPEDIRQYIAYSEGVEYKTSDMSLYHIGQSADAAYIFFYEPGYSTTLDFGFLATLQFGDKPRPSTIVIYADNCLLSKDQLQKHGIIFKKIPRDITLF